MNWKECVDLIKADKSRFMGSVVRIYFANESFQVTFWFRLASFLWERKKTIWFPLYVLVKLIYKHIEYKTGIQLPMGTKVGPGLRFFHYNCIVIAQTSIIGSNVSIHQGVTIGRVFNGLKAGVPTIGSNVVIFAGAKIIGKVNIGNNVVIGANSVVTNDIPVNAVACGIPAKVISEDSSKCFDEYWGECFVHSHL